MRAQSAQRFWWVRAFSHQGACVFTLIPDPLSMGPLRMLSSPVNAINLTHRRCRTSSYPRRSPAAPAVHSTSPRAPLTQPHELDHQHESRQARGAQAHVGWTWRWRRRRGVWRCRGGGVGWAAGSFARARSRVPLARQTFPPRLLGSLTPEPGDTRSRTCTARAAMPRSGGCTSRRRPATSGTRRVGGAGGALMAGRYILEEAQIVKENNWR